MAKERVLITVKTYPVLSDTYIELSCTAGFREDGSWVRIYPIPYRLLDGDKQFHKYQWIELELEHNLRDPRPESFRPKNIDDINLLNTVKTNKQWNERRRLIIDKTEIFTNITKLIDISKKTNCSLAIFKPQEIINFIAEPVESVDWAPEKIKAVNDMLKQDNLFDINDISNFKIAKKLPYKFKYKFRDDEGKESSLMIEDWEIGQLYWNCLKKHGEIKAVEKVQEKYMDDFAITKDLYLFLGTTREWHGRAKNPFIIIGTFHPPPTYQYNLF